MFVQTKCPFCKQTFEYDNSSEGPAVDCPHCGKSNEVAAPASGAAKEMTVQHNAPALAGGKTCPSCKAQVERPAVLCIHCGYNFTTRKKAGGDGWLAANRTLVLFAAGGIVVLAAAAAFLFWPEPEGPPPAFVPAAGEPTASPPATTAPAESAAPAAPESSPATPAAPAETNAPAESAAPPPPPAPTPEELAAQKAEAERLAREAELAAFQAKKFEAEQNLRLQLDVREPLYQQNESVELRRKNGVVDKGTLSGFSGTGTGRVALVATPTAEIGVPLVALDSASRRRLDPEYREAFIQHLMNTQAPAAPAAAPAK
ncbi:MAG: hypothetical protein AB7V14_03095 [Kiritimatiellia bacterium]